MDMIKSRNLTTHTYDETTASKIVSAILDSYYAEFPQVGKAVLYGSRAKGNYRNGSDIDLTICAGRRRKCWK